jgi:hypothetical protein
MTTRRERTIEILQEEIDPASREYFEAIVNETLPQYYLDCFRSHKLWSDDLPGKRLVGVWHPDYPLMKCRGNFVWGLSGALRGAIGNKVVKSSEVIKKVKDFVKHDWNCFKGRKGEYWTQPEEISLINDTLDFVITYLNQEYKLEDNTDLLKQKFSEEMVRVRKLWGE